MFFLLSSFRFCPPLKNDGRGEMRFREAVNNFLPKKEGIRKCKPSPDTGTVAALAVGRGKYEQIRKNSFLQNGIKYLPCHS